MRTAEVILSEFDDPLVLTPPVDAASSTKTVRERTLLETLLNLRDKSGGIAAVYDGTTSVRIIGFIAEKVEVDKYAVVYYNATTGVLAYSTDFGKFVVTV